MTAGLRPYPVYKGSRLPWLGEIPRHWEVARLKNIARVVLGKMLKTSSSPGYKLRPYLRSANVQWWTPSLNDVAEMWFSEPEMEIYRLARGDILVSEGGEVGRACLWEGQIDECYIQNSVHKVSPVKEIRSRFLLFQFFIMGQSGHFESIVNRVSIAHLTREKLVAVRFVIPPLQEQDKIIDFVEEHTEEVRRLISNRRRLIEVLNEQKQAIISRFVTRGIDPNVPLKPSGIEWLGNIPGHWRLVRLKHVSRVQTGITLGKKYLGQHIEERPYLRVANVQTGRLDLRIVKTVAIPPSEIAGSELKPGDVLMTEGGDIDKLGRGCVWNGEIEGCLHQNHIFAVRVDQHSLLPEYLETVAKYIVDFA